MRKFTKNVALAFGALLMAAGINTAKAQAGAALNFDSNAPSDNVVLPSAIVSNSLVGGTKITVEAWVKPTSLTGNGSIVGNFATPLNQMNFCLRRSGNFYQMYVGIGNVATYGAVSSPAATATLSTWQHVAGTYDGTVATIYINGAFSASLALSSYTFAANTNSIIIGTNSAGAGEPFSGEIDEVRIWNTNRNKCEINTYMNCEIPTNAPNLIANYHFNQGTASANNAAVTTLLDGTSNAYTGTLTNMALTGATGNWVAPGGVVSGFTTALAPPSLTINANPSLSTCQNNTIILTASGASTYTWTGGVTNAVAFTASATTGYTITGTNAVTSCTNNAVANVTANICPGASLRFDGANDGVRLPSAISTSLAGSNALTIEAWIKPTNLSGVRQIVCNHSPGASQYVLDLQGNSIEFFITPGGIYSAQTAANTVTLNVWQHIAAVFDGNSCKIYINGVLSASSATFATYAILNPAVQSPSIGADGFNQYFQGDMDEVRLWKSGRTKCEINTFMNCEIPANSPNLMANFHLNQGAAFGANGTVTIANDATSSANNGTLTSFALTAGNVNSNWVSPGAVASGFTTALAPPSFTNSALAFCQGGTVVLGSTGATTFTWNPSITNNVAFTPTASASYSYAGTNSVTTCSVTSVANVTVNPNPTVTAATSASSFICTGQSATLTAGGASSYTWNTSATTSVIVVSPTTTTIYTVTGSDGNGCMGMATITQSVDACTGLTGINSNELVLQIFPNPSSGVFNLKVSTEMSIEVFDILGNSVLEAKLQAGDYKLSLSEYSKGMYIVKCTSQGQIKSYRLIKD